MTHPKNTEDSGYGIVASGRNYRYPGSDKAISGERQGRHMVYSKGRAIIKYLSA